MPNPVIPLSSLTSESLDGSGVFDTLMRANKAHLEGEFQKNRIKGTEYATVYLGSLESVMRTSLDFLLQREKVALEAELMAQQVLIAQAEVQKANAMVQVALKEVEKIGIELEIMQLNKEKIPYEIAHLQAQTALITQQTANAVIEATVLTATKCKLDAEFDLLVLQKDRVGAETALMNQKVATEKAQTTALGVDGDSVIGKQKSLYQAQTDGFSRDAEQKAAKLMVDSWNVRRTTDEGTVADGTNMLADSVVGRAVSKMLSGVNA